MYYLMDMQDEKYISWADRLKGDVKRLIHEVMDPLAMLELIDAVQRLGLKYQFEKDIKKVLDVIYKESADAWFYSDLHGVALRFRLLRQHGYSVPQGTSHFTKNLM